LLFDKEAFVTIKSGYISLRHNQQEEPNETTTFEEMSILLNNAVPDAACLTASK
jgi:hypothetical protein